MTALSPNSADQIVGPGVTRAQQQRLFFTPSRNSVIRQDTKPRFPAPPPRWDAPPVCPVYGHTFYDCWLANPEPRAPSWRLGQFRRLSFHALSAAHRFARLQPRFDVVNRHGYVDARSEGQSAGRFPMGGNPPISRAGASDTRTLVPNPVPIGSVSDVS